LSVHRYLGGRGAIQQEAVNMQIGDVLNGTYRIERPLGVGGQARVWQARHLRLPRTFAIKECPLNVLDSRERLERRILFERERDILAALSHPGHPAIPKIIDFWEEPNYLFMVMDLVEGDTLSDVLLRRRRVTEAEAVNWGKQIAEVLVYLHNWNPPIIYRDLSPDNVMLDRSGQLHLIDFGIARIYKPGQARNTVSLGKVGYASPEHLAGGKAQTDARSDVYTAGALLYHLLTGQEPIPVVDRLKHRAGLLGGRPLLLPRTLNPQITPGMEACLLRAMELEPAQRYQSAQELLYSLETGYVPPPLRYPSGPDPLTQRSKSHPVDPLATLGLADSPASRPLSPPPPAAPSRPTSGPGINRGAPPAIERPPQLPQRRTGEPGMAPGQAPATSGPQPPHPTDQNGGTAPRVPSARPPTGPMAGAPRSTGRLGGTNLAGTGHILSGVGPQQEASPPGVPRESLLPVPVGRKPLPPAPVKPRSRLTRRRLLFGLAGVVVAGAGVGVATFFLKRLRPPYAPLFTFKVDGVPVNCVAWAPNVPRLASGANNNLIRIWDAQHGKLDLTLTGHKDFVLGVAWAPSGQALASASADKTIRLWDPFQGGAPTLVLSGHTDTVYSVAWSPDNLLLASASADQTVRIWDANKGTLLRTFTGHADAVYSVAWSPDGRLVASGSNDGTAKIWNPNQDGPPLHSLDNHTGLVRGVAWSPNSKQVAAATQGKVLTVWNADTSFPPAYTLSGPTDALTSVSWSNNGALLAAGSSDQQVTLWAAQNDAQPSSLTGHTGMVTMVAWSGDNALLASASTDKTIIVWQKQE
jgi:serine/threonine protein kinase